MEADRVARIFRPEALRHHEGRQEEGDVLRLSPAWTRWAYWALLGVLGAVAVFAAVARVPEYASGPAVVRVDGKSDLTVDLAGVVSEVSVQPGARVAAGQPLVGFLSREETAALDRIQREFDLQLIRVLRDPTDAAARQTLTSLRAERELALARQRARTLRAPHAGTVRDVRVRPGQYVSPGQGVVSIIGDDVRVSLVALLPGGYRPLLVPGKPLRVELDGFEHEYHGLVVESVSDQILGPAEVRRALGDEVADALPLNGPMVLVRARVPATTFFSRGRRFDFFDGMVARADAKVRSERIAVLLVPGLKGVLSHERR